MSLKKIKGCFFMKMEIVVLNKNFYSMEGQSGANVTILGDYSEDAFKAGISISEAPIPYNEHEKVNTFPAKYRVTGSFGEIKNRGGKKVTGITFSNFEFLNKVELKDVQVGK